MIAWASSTEDAGAGNPVGHVKITIRRFDPCIPSKKAPAPTKAASKLVQPDPPLGFASTRCTARYNPSQDHVAAARMASTKRRCFPPARMRISLAGPGSAPALISRSKAVTPCNLGGPARAWSSSPRHRALHRSPHPSAGLWLRWGGPADTICAATRFASRTRVRANGPRLEVGMMPRR